MWRWPVRAGCCSACFPGHQRPGHAPCRRGPVLRLRHRGCPDATRCARQRPPGALRRYTFVNGLVSTAGLVLLGLYFFADTGTKGIAERVTSLPIMLWFPLFGVYLLVRGRRRAAADGPPCLPIHQDAKNRGPRSPAYVRLTTETSNGHACSGDNQGNPVSWASRSTLPSDGVIRPCQISSSITAHSESSSGRPDGSTPCSRPPLAEIHHGLRLPEVNDSDPSARMRALALRSHAFSSVAFRTRAAPGPEPPSIR